MSNSNVKPFWAQDILEGSVYEVVISLHNAFKFDNLPQETLTLLHRFYEWLKLPAYTFSITQQLEGMSFSIQLGAFTAVQSSKSYNVGMRVKIYQCGIPLSEGTGSTVIEALCDAWSLFFTTHSLEYLYHFFCHAGDTDKLAQWLKQRHTYELKMLMISNSFLQ